MQAPTLFRCIPRFQHETLPNAFLGSKHDGFSPRLWPLITKIQPKWGNEKTKYWQETNQPPFVMSHENWPFAVSPTFPVWIHCPRALPPLSLPRHLLECPWRLDVSGRWMKVKVWWDGDLCNYASLFTRCRNRVFHHTRGKQLEKRTVNFAQNTLDWISASFAVFNENKKDSIMM